MVRQLLGYLVTLSQVFFFCPVCQSHIRRGQHPATSPFIKHQFDVEPVTEAVSTHAASAGEGTESAAERSASFTLQCA